jgi:putative oxidoreductase
MKMKRFYTLPLPVLASLATRLVLGGMMMYHGYPGIPTASGAQDFAGYLSEIGVPFPLAGAYLSKAAEFFGGLFILLGFLKRPAALVLAFNFVVAAFVAHAGKITGEAELSFIYLMLSLIVAAQGTQAYELDRVIFKK